VAINVDAVLAGISAAGASGAELAWFAPSGTTAPTDTEAALAVPANEQQTVTITGTPTGGTFTLSYAGQTTAGIAYNATASAVQTALRALSTVGSTGATVTGGPGPATPFVVTFGGFLAGSNIAQMTASAASLTGGTSPAIAVTTTTPGATGFYSAGLVTEDGLEKALSESSNDVKAYGLFVPVRKIITSSEITFKVSFLETSLVALSLYDRLPLTGSGAITPDSTGAFSIQEGTARSQRYAAAFEIVDGVNHIRMYAPSVEVTDRDGFTTKSGEVIVRGVTLTAYVNSSGVSVETFYKIPALAAA
jgi:fermentation-respiration switch protein FrsA (DUF1100 family)